MTEVKRILLGVTGGIAAYKALELVRLWTKAGHQVQVVMTEGAKAFIQPLSFQALSGRPVRDSLFEQNQEAGMGHIELARWPDVIVIAPCSAETLAKLRMGRADDLLMTVCLATDKPIVLAPAMNKVMWHNPATQENCAKLTERGFALMPPDSGAQACGDVGEGRLPDPLAIAEFVASFLVQKVQKQQEDDQAWLFLRAFWQNKTLLLTAGPTLEDIDPVRYIGNRSSGKMGFAIAQVAAKAGAKVILVAGPVALSTPVGAVERINVRSAEQMFAAVQAAYAQADVFISAAAVADYRPVAFAKEKIKKVQDQSTLNLQLVKNPDIVAWVAAQSPKPWVVGFAAETEQVLTYARRKLEQKNLDMVCANQVGANQGFDQPDNALVLLTQTEQVALPLSSKFEQAMGVLSQIAHSAPARHN